MVTSYCSHRFRVVNIQAVLAVWQDCLEQCHIAVFDSIWKLFCCIVLQHPSSGQMLQLPTEM